MELVVIISTITAFFSHYLIDKNIIANVVSVLAAIVISWLLVSLSAQHSVGTSALDLFILFATVLAISMLVGLVFAQHKKCAKK